MASRKRRSWVWILLALLLILSGAAFFSVRALSRNPTRIAPEKLVRVERMDLARSVVATGKIEPTTKVEIKSKASGIILKLPVNVGDVVRQGQVICELDQNDLQPRVRQAQAALSIAEAALKSSEAEHARTKIEAEGPDLPFLKRDMERARIMYENKVAAQTVRDDAEKNYELARNRQQTAIANLSVMAAAIRKAEASVEQARAQLNQAEEDLRNATIVSPIDGVVLSRDREPGDAVSSILTMGSGATLIMTVGDLREVYVKGKVDESDIGKVFLGQPARITVESYKDRKFQGKVTKISPMGVEKDNVTTFEVRVSISNESRRLLATMTANAEILLEERKGILAVPEGAIIYKKDRTAEVEVPDGATESGKRRVAVTLGITNGSKMQILSGVGEGQQVVLQ
ncbi:MAG TPA: efflux RND transporter periplasmic adaptor subunit [Verrucomicrobiae bacterium]|nr:efflux RND transporter periplasmic adaptor subunit [Verrucomicrobiae bacterium]